MGDNHVFNPTSIAEVRFSYLENYNFQDPLSNGFNMSSINSNYGAIPASPASKSGPCLHLAIQGYSVGPNLSQLHWNNNIWAAVGSFTKILGKHSIKSGGNWRQVLWEAYGGSSGITIYFASRLHRQPQSTPASRQCPRPRSCLASRRSTSTTPLLPTYAFLHNYGLFVEDTFQATPKLTVTAGLRWEQPGSFSEEHNIGAVFVPGAPLTLAASVPTPIRWARPCNSRAWPHCWIHRSILPAEKKRSIGRHSPRAWGSPIASILRASSGSVMAFRSSRQFSIRMDPS